MDLDDTLLDKDKKIHPKTIERIKALRNNNIQIVLISGRHLFEIMPYAKELSLSKNDYIVAGDGAYIYDGFGKKCILKNLIPFGLLKSLSKVEEMNLFVVANHADFICNSAPENRRLIDNLIAICQTSQKIKKIQISKKRLWILKFFKIEKIFLKGMGLKSDKTPPVDSLLKFSVVIYDYFTELLEQKAGKYNALKFLSESGRIDSLQKVVFFGDSYNDLECFEKLPSAVAVNNAIPEILEKAFFITNSNNEDGVGVAIDKLFDL